MQCPTTANHQGAGGCLDAPPAQRCWPTLSQPWNPVLALLTHATMHVSSHLNSCQPTAMMHKPTPVPTCLVPTLMQRSCCHEHKHCPCTGTTWCTRQPLSAPPALCSQLLQLLTSHWAHRAPQHASPTTFLLLRPEHSMTRYSNIAKPSPFHPGLRRYSQLSWLCLTPASTAALTAGPRSDCYCCCCSSSNSSPSLSVQ